METCASLLTEEQIAVLPTEEDVAFYEEHGWYISPKILPEEVIDRAVLAIERYYQGERNTPLPTNSGFGDWKIGDGDGIRNNEHTWLQSKDIRQLALQPAIGAIAARLTRTKSIRIFQDQIICKPPTNTNCTGAIGWHTDHAYVSNSTSNNLLAAWIPLQDCDLSMGPLVMLDGSHKWSGTEHMRLFNKENLTEIADELHQAGHQLVEVPMTLKKGQISFHHCWLVHGSYPNHSNSLRLAMAVHLQDETNRYQPFWNTQGKQIHHFLDQLCRKLPNGYPDYTDPKFFPIIWSDENNPTIAHR
ncbi:phytanoyl-CoA dioxygenase family protein [Chroococcidiopsis sp. CCNUC1]|uniref:phytanoyl-CoA dioxygenase family protein n=1 Tax=Chroococcidiopsis sp. CCNUC1 TaxID=2653189 RepID=UPI002022607C|nr:phytanoyl-CoA dioxygenase family protein [Chroococcidiopsis sp. CCNUC1]URD51583.1 phytanoyl-CoA dioxygenase family protein [Chroococcidiopsis sp. CCNUC1]